MEKHNERKRLALEKKENDLNLYYQQASDYQEQLEKQLLER